MEIIAKLLNGNVSEQQEGIKEVESCLEDMNCEAVIVGLIENGVDNEIAKFVVTECAEKWITNYWNKNGFSKKNMEFIQKTDKYNFVMN